MQRNKLGQMACALRLVFELAVLALLFGVPMCLIMGWCSL